MQRIPFATLVALSLSFIALAGLTTVACGGGGVPADAIATVGEVSVPVTAFEELLAQTETQTRNTGGTMPAEGSATFDRLKASISSYLVQTEVIKQSAGALGVSVSDQEVDDQVAQLEKDYGKKVVQKRLDKEGMTMDLFRRTMRAQMLQGKVAQVVTKSASVSDTDIMAYWRAHKSELVKDKKTATFAKAKESIRSTLLTAAKQKLWTAWLNDRATALGVQYASAYDPKKLLAAAAALASSSPSVSPSPSVSLSPSAGTP